MNTIRMDESGTLVHGLFYELDVPFLNAGPDPIPECLPAGTISMGASGDTDLLYAEVCCEATSERSCKRDDRHRNKCVMRDIRVDLYGGLTIPEIVHDVNGLTLVISATMKEKLLASGLQGFAIHSLPIGVNQSDCDDPDLYRIEFLGRDMERMLTLDKPHENRCPFCGFEPVLCPECGNIEYSCPQCSKGILFRSHLHVDPSGLMWRMQPYPRAGRVLNGEAWDHSDFIAGPNIGIVSRKAVDWLVENRIGPFDAKPCRVDPASLR